MNFVRPHTTDIALKKSMPLRKVSAPPVAQLMKSSQPVFWDILHIGENKDVYLRLR